MHPRIAELLEYIDAQAANLQSAFDQVAPDRRAVRPMPERWSPAEIVHHLAIVERRLTQQLAALIEQAQSHPPETDTTPLFPMTSATRVELRGRRVVTPAANEPRDTDPDRVWSDFMEARAALTKVIATGDGLALGAVTAPHPMLGAFTAYEWIAFAGAHAARHADQIREMTVRLPPNEREPA
jgi:DinB family protein